MARRLSLWLVALALVAAQTLGLLHRVVHAPLGSPATSTQSFDPVADQRSWSQEIFSGHDGDPGCRLFDQLNASGVLTDLPAVALLAAATPFFLSWSQGETVARRATPFDARGPPAFR